MNKLIVSALLVAGAMLAQTAPAPTTTPAPAQQTAPKAKKGKRCTVRTSYGTITTVVTKAGKVTVTIRGKVGKKKLALGAVRIEVAVRDAAGNVSKVVAKSAKVKK